MDRRDQDVAVGRVAEALKFGGEAAVGAGWVPGTGDYDYYGFEWHRNLMSIRAVFGVGWKSGGGT